MRIPEDWPRGFWKVKVGLTCHGSGSVYVGENETSLLTGEILCVGTISKSAPPSELVVIGLVCVKLTHAILPYAAFFGFDCRFENTQKHLIPNPMFQMFLIWRV